MSNDVIVVFGGSGFVGRYVVRALSKAGKRVRVAMRRPHLGQDLRVMGDVGQIQLVQANVRNPESVARALEGATGVINLVGILYESGKQSFQSTQLEGARVVAAESAKAGITRFVQMSALGADPASASNYGRTKGEAEQAVLGLIPSAAILRPSIIFGPEDNFFNQFAAMARMSPALPLIGGGNTKFQPVYVGNVAEAAVNALDSGGGTYELGGPRTYSFKEILEYILKEIERPRFLAPLPFFIAQPLGAVLNAVFKLYPFAGPPLTDDQVVMLKTDNVVSAGAKTLADLRVTILESVESIVPTYLYRFKPYGQFQVKRKAS
ncbi:complex I NDUFA9 subunit family protein [Aquidulcibacter sp.]|uniref:complex I NDUFA9 subunit family protein n=1 Tax=Aquidulcibacter sp. TaxID=2052990 RepID=UPI0025C447AC|nr:complex I NDUFA9 subunit family protein [Aquidulcibacter sp.]MCA3695270.1 complex I NDUFA9 subunit family protein [Aquidulcibacter sp.]